MVRDIDDINDTDLNVRIEAKLLELFPEKDNVYYLNVG